MANTLADKLADLYSDKKTAKRIVDDAGLKWTAIQTDGTLLDVWHDILIEARKQTRVNAITDIACAEYPTHAEEIRALAAQFAASPIPTTPARERAANADARTQDAKVYQDFNIYVTPRGTGKGKFQVWLDKQLPGGGYTTNGDKENGTFDASIFTVAMEGMSVDLLEAIKRRRITETQLYKLGALLSDLILPNKIRKRLLDSLIFVTRRQDNQCLRVRLFIEVEELISLPWEYLYLNVEGTPVNAPRNFLALHPNISIVRTLRIDAPEPQINQDGRYRLVAAFASPKDQEELNLEQDRATLARVAEQTRDVGAVELAYVEHATLRKLIDALRTPADIFHFSGHGTTGYILLENEDGTRYDYDPNSLATLLRAAHVKLVILGACQTSETTSENSWSGVAQAVMPAGVVAAVANQFTFQDRNAPALVENLYRDILAGLTIDEAVFNARQVIFQTAGLVNRDWGSIALYSRAPSGILFRPQANQQTLTQRGVTGETKRAAETIDVPRVAPAPLQTPLIGRDAILTQVSANLKNGGKYYVIGSYGVGKTALMTELFYRAIQDKTYSDGYFWGRVSEMNVERVLEWIAAQFRDPRVAQQTDRMGKTNALREVLAERSDMLIGLDEVRDAAVAEALLDAAGNCTVLLNGLTARVIGQVQPRKLEPFQGDEGARAFLTMAGAQPETLSPAQRDRVKQICGKLGNLPLALKLAALKYAEGESLETLWERLQVAPETIIPEHAEVSTIFEPVYADLQHLASAELVLVRLASFPALEAPVRVLSEGIPAPTFFRCKDKLLASGVVTEIPGDRFALHPLLGLLARGKADAALVESEGARMASWLQNYAEQNQDDYAALAREHSNLLGMLDAFRVNEQHEQLIAMCQALFEYLRVRGYWAEARSNVEAALLSAQNLKRRSDEAWAEIELGVIDSLQGDYALARERFVRAEQLYQQENNVVGRGLARYRQGTCSASIGDLDAAKAELEQGLEWLGDTAPARDRASAHLRLANVVAVLGDPQTAREHLKRALELASDNSEESSQAHVLFGMLLRQAGELQEAESHFQQALQMAERLGNPRDVGVVNSQWGDFYYYQGEYDQALERYQAAQTIFETLHYKRGSAQAFHSLGNIAFAKNDLTSAQEKYKAALALNREINNALAAASDEYQLALIAQRQGNLDEAERGYNAMLQAAQAENEIALCAAALHQLGQIELARKKFKPAQAYAERAHTLAVQVQDRQSEASALYLLGLTTAYLGSIPTALDYLVQAHNLFAALRAPEAKIVEQVLQSIEQQIGAGLQQPLFVKEGEVYRVVEGGGLPLTQGIGTDSEISQMARDNPIDVTVSGGAIHALQEPAKEVAQPIKPQDEINIVVDGGQILMGDIVRPDKLGGGEIVLKGGGVLEADFEEGDVGGTE